MAIVYPSELPRSILDDPKLSGEVQVYRALRDSLDNNWHAFYSVAWLGRKVDMSGGHRDGEADFVLGHPEFGILVLEVKGGRVRYDSQRQQWVSTDRQDEDHDIYPLQQLKTSKYVLINKLRSLPSLTKVHINAGHVMVLPHSIASGIDLPADTPRDIIVDGEDMQGDLAERFRQICAYWLGQHGEQKNGAAVLTGLKYLLARDIDLPNPLVLYAMEDQKLVVRQTEEQFRLLDALGRDSRVAVSGCAGSGKTFIAAHKAKQLAREGFRTALVCASQLLADGLLKPLAANQENLDAFSSRELCQAILIRAGKELPPNNSEAELIQAALQTTSDDTTLGYDAMIIDEAQDLGDDFWELVEWCVAERTESVLYVFYDDNQQVYPCASKIPERLKLNRQPLLDNVRNTQAIHRLAVRFHKGNHTPLPRGPSGTPVEHLAYQDNLSKQLGRVLHRLVAIERFKPADVIVLTPKDADRSELKQMKQSGSFTLVPYPDGPGSAIQWATVADFKGLERLVVIVVELDASLNSLEHRDALYYVAFSRASAHLVLLGDAQVLQHFKK